MVSHAARESSFQRALGRGDLYRPSSQRISKLSFRGDVKRGAGTRKYLNWFAAANRDRYEHEPIRAENERARRGIAPAAGCEKFKSHRIPPSPRFLFLRSLLFPPFSRRSSCRKPAGNAGSFDSCSERFAMSLLIVVRKVEEFLRNGDRELLNHTF